MRVARWLVPVLAFLVLACASTAQAHSTTTQQIKSYKRIAQKHEGTLRFFANRSWMLAPRYEKCWQAPGVSRRKVCRVARREVANSRARLANVHRMIEKLSEVRGPLGNTSAWNCIHRYERDPRQGWATRTGNGYYGGLQMDVAFQRSHGLDLYLRKGTANNWTAEEQMMVAQRAYSGVYTGYKGGRVVLYRGQSRGYYPWPNTARSCGLI